MFWNKKNREENRYYLLPGMGRANRRKHALYLKVGIGVGFLVSAIIAAVMFYIRRPGL